MATVKIPVRGDLPHYTFTIDLDGTAYQFEFKWNERMGYWTFDLSLEDGTPVIGSVVVTVNADLISRYTGQALPKGQLFTWDTSGVGQEIQSINELGDRVLLLYKQAG